MVDAVLGEHGLVIQLKEPVPPEEEPVAVKATTFTPAGTQICHPAPPRQSTGSPPQGHDRQSRKGNRQREPGRL
nr:MAG TPA: hypothetical protein [Caudoviricetes sp.]